MAIRVAVVTLNLNGKDRLVRCLEGCQRLETQGLELQVVCVDNHSTDGSVAEVRRLFPKVDVIVNPRNLGFARAYNEAIRAVDCDWVAFLNNDAVPDPGWLVEALAAAKRHGAPCVGSTILKDGGARVDFVGSTKKCQRRLGVIVQDKDRPEIAKRLDIIRVEAKGLTVFHQGLLQRSVAMELHTFQVGILRSLRNLFLKRLDGNRICRAGLQSRFIAISMQYHDGVFRRPFRRFEVEIQP